MARVAPSEHNDSAQRHRWREVEREEGIVGHNVKRMSHVFTHSSH